MTRRVIGGDRNRALAADEEAGLKGSVARRAARPVVIWLRRWWSRIRLATSGPLVGSSVQWTLLSRIDTTATNAEGPPSYERIRSQACRAVDIMTPEYAEWADRLGDSPRFHRKQWEHITILEAARQAGVLHPGREALGFGVGTEPIPAALTSFGLRVLATDQAAAVAGHWVRRGEHASGLDALVKPSIVDPETFRSLARFQSIDMNGLPGDLGQYDLVWSSCAIEHLGSPEAGLRFVMESLGFLRPGGLAVHTTEMDLTPGDSAVDYGHCALYRPQDLRQFRQKVVEARYEMDLCLYVALDHPADRFVAPPYSVGKERFHLKLALHDSITTSFALVIRRPLSETNVG